MGEKKMPTTVYGVHPCYDCTLSPIALSNFLHEVVSGEALFLGKAVDAVVDESSTTRTKYLKH